MYRLRVCNVNQPKICTHTLFRIHPGSIAAAAKSLQSCPTLCDPIDSSPPGSPIPGILQARTLEWVAVSFSNAWKWKVKVKLLSRVRLLATPWTAAHQAPPSMGFSRQEYWCGVPLPSLRKHQHLLKNQSVENNTVPLAPQRNWQPWIKREGQEFLKFCPLCSAFSSLLTYNLMLHWSKFSLLQQIYRVTFTVGFYSSNTVQVGEGHFLWLSGLVLCLVPPLSHSKKWSMSH